MSCPNCEKARQEGKTFCTQCGERLIPETPAPPPQQANREPAPQQRSQWSGVYQEPAQTPAPNPVPPPAYTPYAAVPPEPKKKRSVLPIIVIALLVAALGAVAVLFATGVISFGGGTGPRAGCSDFSRLAEGSAPRSILRASLIMAST